MKKMMMYRNKTFTRVKQKGSVIVLSLIITTTMLLMGIKLAEVVGAQYSSFKTRVVGENALEAADAGVRSSLIQLNKDSAWVPPVSPQTLYSDATRGKATYEIQFGAPRTDGSIEVQSTGKYFRTSTDSTPANTKKVKAIIAADKTTLDQSFVIGSGGLHMLDNSKIPNNDVYIRGQLFMNQNASIGTSTTPISLTLANVGCTVAGVWPQPCPDEPIKMLNATPGTINGTVCANGQTTPTGISDPYGVGLDTTCKAPVTAAPRFDKKSFIDSINASGIVRPASDFRCSTNLFSDQTIVIAAGTHITGNLVTNHSSAISGTDMTGTPFSFPKNFGSGICKLVIEGDVYIDGILAVGDRSRIIISDTVGTEKPVIVMNDRFGPAANSSATLISSNSLGTPGIFISFWSTNKNCSLNEQQPSATVQTCLTGTEPKDSATLSSFSTAASGSFTLDLRGAIFYSYYGVYAVAGNGGVTWQFNAFGSQGFYADKNVSLETTAEDAPFSNVLSIIDWKLVDYRQVYN